MRPLMTVSFEKEHHSAERKPGGDCFFAYVRSVYGGVVRRICESQSHRKIANIIIVIV